MGGKFNKSWLIVGKFNLSVPDPFILYRKRNLCQFFKNLLLLLITESIIFSMINQVKTRIIDCLDRTLNINISKIKSRKLNGFQVVLKQERIIFIHFKNQILLKKLFLLLTATKRQVT